MIKRVITIVLDGFGVGESPDAYGYKDKGSNTIAGIYNNTKLNLPNMKKIGLFNIEKIGIENKEENDYHVRLDKDLWFLDGSQNLNGKRILDAERREEELT